MEYQQHRVTSNGVDVYSYRQNHLHSFCIGLYVKAGVLYEAPEETGVTHFLEHVLFRNLGGMPQRELYERLEAMGAYFNACTYKDFVQFYIMAAPAYFRQCAEIMARLLLPLAVTEKDVNIERRRIQNEIREEDYRTSLEYLAAAEVWKESALARPIMGTITGVSAIGLPALSAAHAAMFRTDNLCFYVTGSFEDDDIDALCRLAGACPVAPGPGPASLMRTPGTFHRRDSAVRVFDTDEMPSVLFSFDVDYGRYAMAETQLIYDILFKGNLSRFQTLLSERRGLIYSFDAVLDQYGGIGAMYAEYSVSAGRLLEAVRLTSGIFRSMRESVTDADLALHLPRYGDNYDVLLDEPERLNWDMAFDNFLLGRGFTGIDDVKRQFAAVRPERLMQIAREILVPDNLVITAKAPRRKVRAEKIREAMGDL